MADACADRDRIRVVPLAKRQWVLLHLDTCEIRDLPEAIAYEIEYDESGAGCLIPDDGDATWASDILQWHMYAADNSGALWVQFAWRDSAAEMISLEVARKIYRIAQVRIQLGHTSATLEHSIAIWTLPLCGSRVYWSLLDLWQALDLGKVLSKQTASGWLYRRWRAFDGYLRQARFQVGLLRSYPLRTGAGELAPQVPRERLLPFPSLSSAALLALLSRQCFALDGFRDSQSKAASREYLEALLRLCWKVGASLSLPLDPDAGLDDFGFVNCPRLVDIFCLDSLFCDCSSLLEQSRSMNLDQVLRGRIARLLELLPNASRVSALDLLRALAGFGAELLPWLGPLCMQLGRRLENELWDPDVPVSTLATQWEEGSRVRAADLADTISQRDRRLWAHLCTTQAMTKDALYLSCAVDASRIGKRHLLLGVVVNNSNNGAGWMLPQEHCGKSEKSRVTKKNSGVQD